MPTKTKSTKTQVATPVQIEVIQEDVQVEAVQIKAIQPETIKSWNGVLISSMIVRVAKVEEQATSASGVTYTKMLVVQNERGDRSNWFNVIAFDSEKTNVSTVVSKNVVKGSTLELRNIKVNYEGYVRQDGTVGVSGKALVNSNAQIQFIHLPK